jgi:hypothetical protein
MIIAIIATFFGEKCLSFEAIFFRKKRSVTKINPTSNPACNIDKLFLLGFPPTANEIKRSFTLEPYIKTNIISAEILVFNVAVTTFREKFMPTCVRSTYRVMLALRQWAGCWPLLSAGLAVMLAHTVQVARVACSGTRHTSI